MFWSDDFARSAARRGPVANAWSMDDVRLLRELAERNVPLEAIASTLRRSTSAIKNKASLHGISLRSAGRAMPGSCRK